jgi:hypothetical protein
VQLGSLDPVQVGIRPHQTDVRDALVSQESYGSFDYGLMIDRDQMLGHSKTVAPACLFSCCHYDSLHVVIYRKSLAIAAAICNAYIISVFM